MTHKWIYASEFSLLRYVYDGERNTILGIRREKIMRAVGWEGVTDNFVLINDRVKIEGDY